MAIDLRNTIIPKSDQLNADDLIGGTKTVKITKVSIAGSAEQPVAISYEGDNGKPYLPCKSMRRVMVNVWGSDGNNYIGRSMTLYRDDKVTWGGMAVGGIRISHMSHIDREITMALTATKSSRKPFIVKPLTADEDHKLSKEQQQGIVKRLSAANIEPQTFKDAFGVTSSLGELKTSQMPNIEAWIDGNKSDERDPGSEG